MRGFILSLFTSVLLLSGCSMLEDLRGKNEIIYNAGIRIMTEKAIDGDTDKAQDLAELATFVKTLALDSEIVVTEIDDLLRNYIIEKRYPVDQQALYLEFVALVRDYVAEKIRSNELSENHKVIVGHTADLVLQVTARYNSLVTA